MSWRWRSLSGFVKRTIYRCVNARLFTNRDWQTNLWTLEVIWACLDKKTCSFNNSICGRQHVFLVFSYKGTQSMRQSCRWILWKVSSSSLTLEALDRLCRTLRIMEIGTQSYTLLIPEIMVIIASWHLII